MPVIIWIIIAILAILVVRRSALGLLIEAAAYKALGSWHALFARLLREPGLAMLADAEPLLAKPLGIAAVVVGAIALSAANKGTARGKGMAITGIVTGAIGLVVGIGMAILWNVPEFQEEFWSGYCEEDPTTFPDMCD